MKLKELAGCKRENIENPVYFNKTLSLGELKAGKYIFYYQNEAQTLQKEMLVKKANEISIDEALYAPISNIFIPELIYTTQRAQVVLTGIYHNNCQLLENNHITVTKLNNVYVILPKSKLLAKKNCETKKYPIQQIVDLGKIQQPGIYLIHVRSLSGLSVNKVFFVENRQFSPNSSF